MDRPDPSDERTDATKKSGLTLGRLTAFALPAGPSAAIDTPLSVYAPAFYAGPMGLGLSLVGTLFLISRIAEIPIGMMVGMVSDRWGGVLRRRRFWLSVATPVVMVAIWRLFVPPHSASGAYLLGWLLVLIAGSTLLQVNHVAWGSEITTDYHERTRVQGSRQVLNVAGLVLVLLPPILIERAHLPNLDGLRMQSVAWFVLVLLPISVGCAVFLAPERAAPKPLESRTLREALRTLASNHPLRVLLLVDLFDASAIGVVTSMFLFLSGDVWGLGHLSSLMLLAYLISGVICLGPILRFARGRSKHRLAAVIALALAFALPAILLVPPGAAGWAIACTMLLGAPSAVNSALFDSVMGDVAAFDAATSQRSRAGLLYALHMIMGRLGRGLAIAACYAILDRIGFHTHAHNTGSVLLGFKLLYVVPPVLLQLGIATLMWNFPLGEAAHDTAQKSRELDVVATR